MAKQTLNEATYAFHSFMNRMNKADYRKEKSMLNEMSGVFSSDDPEWASELEAEQGKSNKDWNDHIYPIYMDAEWKDEEGKDNPMAQIIRKRAEGDNEPLALRNDPYRYDDEPGEEELKQMEYNHDLDENPEGTENEYFDDFEDTVDGDEEGYIEEAKKNFNTLLERMDRAGK